MYLFVLLHCLSNIPFTFPASKRVKVQETKRINILVLPADAMTLLVKAAVHYAVLLGSTHRRDIYIYICVHVYTYTHIYTHTHIHIYIYMYSCSCVMLVVVLLADCHTCFQISVFRWWSFWLRFELHLISAPCLTVSRKMSWPMVYPWRRHETCFPWCCTRHFINVLGFSVSDINFLTFARTLLCWLSVFFWLTVLWNNALDEIELDNVNFRHNSVKAIVQRQLSHVIGGFPTNMCLIVFQWSQWV